MIYNLLKYIQFLRFFFHFLSLKVEVYDENYRPYKENPVHMAD